MNIAEIIDKKQKEALSKLLKIYGSKYRIAKELGISSPSVDRWYWNGQVSKKGAIQIEELTNGKVTKEELRPDVLNWGK